MINPMMLSISAVVSLFPATLLPLRRKTGERDAVFWAVILVAVAGPLAYTVVRLQIGWPRDFAGALWLAISMTMAVFAFGSAFARDLGRLSVLLMPYLTTLAVLALVAGQFEPPSRAFLALDTWFVLHIVFSLASYALATLSAVAGVAVFLREHSMKARLRTGLTDRLPSIADSEGLEFRLLAAASTVLGASILTGMSRLYETTATLLTFDHKTVFSLVAFVLLVGLVALHRTSGMRGRRAARGLLIAYLMLVLAYPGVKFVTDFLTG